ncbi:DMT family transporter [Telmatobacter bradus]|uniref:DMT family transporter n=1 Tax=Telmatobacter bradus TaxID=474953 RepID=UPI003B438554
MGYGACALAGCLWGTGFYFGRLALNEMNVEHMVLYRFLFACLGMVLILLLNRRGKPQAEGRRMNRGEIGLMLLTALLGIPLQFLIQFHGLALTTVSHASLMVGSMPVMLAVAFGLLGSERLDGFCWMALAASTGGAALVALGGGGAAGQGKAPLTGDLMVCFSLFIALFWILWSKKLMENHRPIMVTAGTIFSGTAMLAGVVVFEQVRARLIGQPFEAFPFAHVSLRAWIALALSGLLCTATTTSLWNWGIHHVPAARAGVFLNLEPVVGSVLGVCLLGERLGPFGVLGGGMILAAAVAISLRGHVSDPEMLLE